MNGQIAQICGLVCHLNALRQKADAKATFKALSTTKYCRSVESSAPRKKFFGGSENQTVATNIDEWSTFLMREDFRRAWLTVMSREAYQNTPDRLPSYIASAFVGGGDVWIITTQRSDGRAISWVARWEPVGSQGAGLLPWKVTYHAFNEAWDYQAPKLHEASSALRLALDDISAFAVSEAIPFWPDVFRRSLEWLDGKESPIYHPDICPENSLSDEAIHLLSACQSAWVFGGMGSWNDLMVQDQGEYRRVSAQLYAAVCNGMLTSVNSSALDL